MIAATCQSLPIELLVRDVELLAAFVPDLGVFMPSVNGG